MEKEGKVEYRHPSHIKQCIVKGPLVRPEYPETVGGYVIIGILNCTGGEDSPFQKNGILLPSVDNRAPEVEGYLLFFYGFTPFAHTADKDTAVIFYVKGNFLSGKLLGFLSLLHLIYDISFGTEKRLAPVKYEAVSLYPVGRFGLFIRHIYQYAPGNSCLRFSLFSFRGKFQPARPFYM